LSRKVILEMPNASKDKNFQQRAFVVKAQYAGGMDIKREERIHEAFERCVVRVTRDLLWLENKGTTEIEIELDEHARAERLASVLRACGLTVTVEEVEQ